MTRPAIVTPGMPHGFDSAAERRRRTSGRRHSFCSTARSPSRTIRRRRPDSRSRPRGWVTRRASRSTSTSGSSARIARESVPGIARTPAQAAAVDWAKVIDDAENGIQANIMVNSGGSTGWNVGYQVTRYQDPTWSEMSMMYMGMADVSGAYANFIAADYSHKNGWFLVVTPDQRWPQGTTRAAQNTASVQPTSVDVEAIHLEPAARQRRLRRRMGHFILRLLPLALHQSQQQHGSVPGVPEGRERSAGRRGIHSHRQDRGGRGEDRSHVALPTADLPALSGVVTTATQAVPGGASCVPQVPTGTGTVACGNILEAMKYEKRIENTYAGFGRFWIDGRGWGDLVGEHRARVPGAVPGNAVETEAVLSARQRIW